MANDDSAPGVSYWLKIIEVCQNYRNKGITAEELAFTKESLLNNDVMGFETPFQKVGFLNRITDFDLPKDYTLKQSAMLKDMTVDQINALAKAKLDPNKMVIVVVGNKYLSIQLIYFLHLIKVNSLLNYNL